MSPRRKWLRYVFNGTAVVAAGALGYCLPKLRLSREYLPTRYRVEGATLVVIGPDENELWRHRFPHELRASTYADHGEQSCAFVDLDDDGQIETLFRQVPAAFDRAVSLVCFDATGKVCWEFIPTKTVVDNLGRSFAPPFWTNNFQVFPAERSHSARVAVISHHNWSFPTQVAVLDGKTGKLLTEYWHRGHLLHMASADLDGDGEPEILLGGVNDAPEYKRATLLVFDSRNISGASKNPRGGVYFEGMTPGTEKRVVFFPRTRISRDIEFNQVSVVTVASGRIRVNVVESLNTAGPFVVYEFDFRLRPINVVLSDSLMDCYRERWNAGLLPRESLAAITDRLRSEIVIL